MSLSSPELQPTEMDQEPPDGLFFAGSDDESQDVVMDQPPQQPVAVPTSSPPSSPSTGGLFLHDSDDDDFIPPVPESNATTPPKRGVSEDILDMKVEIPGLEDVAARPLTPVVTVNTHRTSSEVLPPAKKRRLSSPRPPPMLPESATYIGEVVVVNAWSNVSGKGYVKPNDSILVRRDDPDPVEIVSSKPIASEAKKGGKKQVSISSMFKPRKIPNTKKRKADNIVRLLNTKEYEFGRLPTDVSWWVARLLDLGLAEIRGTMTDCPAKLTTGASLIVTLHIYMLPSAFNPIKPSDSDTTPRVMFNEGAETLDEKTLRERKDAILKLFDVVGLKPQAGANFSNRKTEEQLYEEAMKNMTQRKSKKVKEIVGDGEEIEVEDTENLSTNDIDMIYKRAQHNDRTMAEMEPVDSFTLTLRGYQKQALLWMHSLETGKMGAREATSMHPLWSQYLFPDQPVLDNNEIDLPADEKPFYFNPYSGELSLVFPKAERNCRGGILADVGMGKTIMISALIQTNLPSDEDENANETSSSTSKSRQLKLNHAFRPGPQKKPRTQKPPHATLIVAPTSLLSQWSEEIERSSKPGTFKVLVWHGQGRLDLDDAIEEDDEDDKKIKVIITSYGTLASEHAKSEKSSTGKSPIFEIEWLRIVLDEAHHCKSRTSKTAKAVYALNGRRRWAVTGTPIVNKLEDLYSLLKFMDFKPWSDFAFFRSFITLPFLARDPKAIEIVQIILESILLRREKTALGSDGKRIVELPPKEIVVDYLEFSPLERKIYDSIYATAKKSFEQLDAKGLVSKNYTHILAMLMRLRRAVLHPHLVLTADEGRALSPEGSGAVDVNDLVKRFVTQDESGSEVARNAFAEEVLSKLGSEEDVSECMICYDVMQAPMILPECMHQCCRDCILAFLAFCEEKGEQTRCPSCSRGPIKESDLVEVVRNNQDPSSSQPVAAPEIMLRRNDFKSSTKLEALLQNLQRLRDQDPCFRAVVFSQFTSFLDLIQRMLEREGFDHSRFDGSMDIKKRNAAVTEFRSASRRPKVLIVSLKAGGVGLNLTAANYVFMMDCWWNAATENQAIDRVHRIGQDKTVYVRHFIVANTIEARILRIQKRKTAIIKEAFRGSGGKAGADPESIENLKIMFGAADDDD